MLLGFSGTRGAREETKDAPHLGEDAVAVLGGDPHDESPGVGEDPGGHGDQLAAQSLAVGPSVGAACRSPPGPGATPSS